MPYVEAFDYHIIDKGMLTVLFSVKQLWFYAIWEGLGWYFQV